MDIICGQWVVCIIQLLPRSRALTGWATAKNGRRGKTWLFLFSLSFPSSVQIPPFSTLKAKFGYSPHSRSQTDHLVAELSVETVRKMGSLSRPASTQISLSEMVFSAFSRGFNSVGAHKNHLWAYAFPLEIYFCCAATGDWLHLAFSESGADGLRSSTAPSTLGATRVQRF